jgi:hypothetical protein
MQPADKLLNADLLRRVEAVSLGAGRCFRVRTQVLICGLFYVYVICFVFCRRAIDASLWD